MPNPSPQWLVRSRLNVRQLALLVQLDEKRSVLRAAEAAHLTQPAASKLLASLEEGLGAPLFTRHARGVEPTVYGEIVIRHARSALAELRQAHEELTAIRSGLTGEVAIGTAITSATDLVPTAVTALMRKFPRVRLTIELGFSEALVTHLLERKFDMVIARVHNSPGLEEIEFDPLAEEPHAVIAGSNHPLARKRELALGDLAGQTWVLPPPGNVLRDRITELFLQGRLLPPQQVVETSSLPIITSLLAMSEMVAPLAVEVARPYCESGTLTRLPLKLDLRLGVAGILTLRGHRLSPAAHAMLAELQQAAAVRYPRRFAERRQEVFSPQFPRR